MEKLFELPYRPYSVGVILFFAVYLIGAIPFSYLVGRVCGIDIRTIGSGNIGATNLKRALADRRGGRYIALSGYVLDIVKGMVPVLVIAPWAAVWAGLTAFELFQVIAGMAAMIGHIFPVYLKFKGGKGVATAFGVVLGLAPIAGAICLLVYMIVVRVTRYVSLGSMLAAVTLPVAQSIIMAANPNHPGPLDPERGLPVTLFTLFAAVMVIVKHRANIGRLIRHEENKYGVAAADPQHLPNDARSSDMNRDEAETDKDVPSGDDVIDGDR